MNLSLRNLSPLGFRGGLMTQLTSIALLWRTDHATNRIYFTSGYTPNMVGFYQLTKPEMVLFTAGHLILLPPGFCSPGSGRTKVKGPEHAVILHEGDVKSRKHLTAILADGVK